MSCRIGIDIFLRIVLPVPGDRFDLPVKFSHGFGCLPVIQLEILINDLIRILCRIERQTHCDISLQQIHFRAEFKEHALYAVVHELLIDPACLPGEQHRKIAVVEGAACLIIR